MSVLQNFVEIAPFFHQLTMEDCHFNISDTEKWLVSIPGKKLKMAIKEGDPLRDGAITKIAMDNRKRIVRQGNKELYGIAHMAICTPIFENEEVVGCISIGYSMEKSDQISEMANSLAAMLQQISANSQAISSATQELAATTQGLASLSETIRQEMQSISKLNDFTAKIASQTTILGLNASIQSTHAGEYGKGFSVVADEIKKMAEQSRESSGTIKDQIESIKNSVHHMLEHFESANAFITEQAGTSEDLTNAILELSELAQDLNDMAKLSN